MQVIQDHLSGEVGLTCVLSVDMEHKERSRDQGLSLWKCTEGKKKLIYSSGSNMKRREGVNIY